MSICLDQNAPPCVLLMSTNCPHCKALVKYETWQRFLTWLERIGIPIMSAEMLRIYGQGCEKELGDRGLELMRSRWYVLYKNAFKAKMLDPITGHYEPIADVPTLVCLDFKMPIAVNVEERPHEVMQALGFVTRRGREGEPQELKILVRQLRTIIRMKCLEHGGCNKRALYVVEEESRRRTRRRRGEGEEE